MDEFRPPSSPTTNEHETERRSSEHHPLEPQKDPELEMSFRDRVHPSIRTGKTLGSKCQTLYSTYRTS